MHHLGRSQGAPQEAAQPTEHAANGRGAGGGRHARSCAWRRAGACSRAPLPSPLSLPLAASDLQQLCAERTTTIERQSRHVLHHQGVFWNAVALCCAGKQGTGLAGMTQPSSRTCRDGLL